MKDDRKLVKIVPVKDCSPIAAFLAKRHFDEWELKNRTKINEEVERIINNI